MLLPPVLVLDPNDENIILGIFTFQSFWGDSVDRYATC